MSYFIVGDTVVTNAGSEDVLKPRREGVVSREPTPEEQRLLGFYSPVVVAFGESEELVDVSDISLTNPEAGAHVILWPGPHVFTSVPVDGHIVEDQVCGKCIDIRGQLTPLRGEFELSRFSDGCVSRYSPDSLRSICDYLDINGKLVREGDVVTLRGPGHWFRRVVLWDYFKARWCLYEITHGRRLGLAGMRGFEDFEFRVVGHVFGVPPFETGIPVDDRIFPSTQLISARQ